MAEDRVNTNNIDGGRDLLRQAYHDAINEEDDDFVNDLAQDKSETTVVNLNKSLVQPSQNENQISLLQEEVQEPQQNKKNQQLEPLQSKIILKVLRPEQQDIVNQRIDVTQKPNISYSLKTQYNDSIVQTPLPCTIGPSNPQVFGKTNPQKEIDAYKSILPSRDYIMNPVNQVYLPLKNVRVVANTAKILSPQTSQNSVLLYEATTSVPGHVINSSPIFTKTMSVTNTNHIVNGLLYTISTSTQKMGLQYFKAPVQQTTKTPIGQLNNKDSQFTGPTTKVKTNETLVNAAILTPITIKQYQHQPGKFAFIKSQMPNKPLILGTTPVVNTGTLKNPSLPTLLIRNHTSTPSISILEPKIRAANNSKIKQAEQNAHFIRANSLIKPMEVPNCTKPLIATAKIKQNINFLVTSSRKEVVPLVIAEKQEVSGVNKHVQKRQILQDEAKEERNIIVARTRSIPKYLVEDYKHLHPTDFTQPDLDNSNGSYIDYNASGSGVKPEKMESNRPAELLTGHVLPKRKVSDQFKCPTCAKTYLRRYGMAKHFELNPDHRSSDQLLLPGVKYEPQDSLKRRGKKRGMNVHTPEQKAKRRRNTLRDSINACTTEEIAEVAGEKITSSMSVIDFIVKKSGNNVRSLLTELKEFVESLRQKVTTMLSVASNEEKHNENIFHLNDEVLCDILGMNPGFYKINKPFCEETKTDEGQERKLTEISEVDSSEELSQGLPKVEIENDRCSQINQENSIQITTNGNGNNHNGSSNIFVNHVSHTELNYDSDIKRIVDSIIVQDNENELDFDFDFDDSSDKIDRNTRSL